MTPDPSKHGAKPQDMSEESLQSSEIRYRRLFESARDGILILDAESRRITDVNPYMTEMLEYSREEFLGKELYEIGLLRDGAASQEVYRGLQESGYVRYEDLPLETKSGRVWDVEFVCNIYDEDGHQVIQCNIRDNTARKRAEDTKSLLASIVESAEDSIVSVDFNTIITSWNPSAEKLYGYAANEVIGRPLTVLTLPEDLQEVLGNIEKIKQSKKVETFETERVQEDGGRLHLLITLSPIQDAAGEVAGVSTLARDITAHKRAEAALRQSEEYFRLLVEGTKDYAMFLMDTQGRVIHWNAGAKRITGYDKSEVLGQTADLIFTLEDRVDGALEHEMRQAAQHGRADDKRWHLRKDGTRFWADGVMTALYHDDGQLRGFAKIMRDATGEMHMEQALLQSEKNYRLLVDNAPDIIFRIDRDLRHVFVSPVIERLVGIPAAAFLGKTNREMGMPDELVVQWEDRLRRVFETGQASTGEFEFPGTDGSTLYFEARSIPEFGENGTVNTVLSIARDVTQRKQAENDLMEQKQLLQTIFDHLPVMISFFDSSNTFQLANHEWERVLGWSLEEMRGHPDIMAEFYPDPLERQRIVDFMRQATGEWAECKTTVRDGRILDTSWANIRLPDGRRIGIGQDITERKRMEAERSKVDEKFHTLFNAIDEGFCIIKVLFDENQKPVDYLFLEANPSFDKQTGIKDVQGRRMRELAPQHEDYWFETYGRVATTGEPVRFEEYSSCLHRWFDVYAFPVTDSPEPKVGLIFADVTARKQTEAALHAAKAEAERANLAKSEFLSRMSHELRTPLNAILGFAQLLEMDDLNEEQRQGVGQILKGGRHLLGLINEVLDIARIEAGQIEISPEPVLVAEVLAEALDLIRPLATASGISLHDEISVNCPFYVRADRQRLKQILINLLANAVKYNREGGTVTVACRQNTPNEREEASRRRTDTGQASPEDLPPTLCLEIIDTGLGIPLHSMHRLFLPFERLGAEHSAVEGTGVGLALSKRLTELMEGRITAQSTLGEGSTFTVELPLVETPFDTSSTDLSEHDRQTPSSSSTDSPPAHIVLYIEDNLSNRSLVENILLRRPGIELLSTTHGQRGLEMAREHRPDLILLDLHLPDINGDEVMHRLKADPATRDIPVVMLSADATPRQLERLLNAGAAAYLTKPLDVKKFMAILDARLSRIPSSISPPSITPSLHTPQEGSDKCS